MSELEPPKGLDLSQRRRGIYLLPNLFTTAALFAGFFAIVQAMNGKYTLAAISIFIAMVLDGLDGRVARMTHTQSAFGAEYDSLVGHGVVRRCARISYLRMGIARFGALGMDRVVSLLRMRSVAFSAFQYAT